MQTSTTTQQLAESMPPEFWQLSEQLAKESIAEYEQARKITRLTKRRRDQLALMFNELYEAGVI